MAGNSDAIDPDISSNSPQRGGSPQPSDNSRGSALEDTASLLFTPFIFVDLPTWLGCLPDHLAQLASCTVCLYIPQIYISSMGNHGALSSVGGLVTASNIQLQIDDVINSLRVQYTLVLSFCTIAVPMALTTLQVSSIGNKPGIVTGINVATIFGIFCLFVTWVLHASLQPSNATTGIWNNVVFGLTLMLRERIRKNRNPCDIWILITTPFILASWATIVYTGTLLLHFMTGPAFWLGDGPGNDLPLKFNNLEIMASTVGLVILVAVFCSLRKFGQIPATNCL